MGWSTYQFQQEAAQARAEAETAKHRAMELEAQLAEAQTVAMGAVEMLDKALVDLEALQRRGGTRRLVILESPYAGDVEGNAAYARRCLRDSLKRGEAPLASHLLYTQPGVLNDDDPAERACGIEAGLAWGAFADATVVYLDRGLSEGMRQGIERAEAEGRPVECRRVAGGLIDADGSDMDRLRRLIDGATGGE